GGSLPKYGTLKDINGLSVQRLDPASACGLTYFQAVTITAMLVKEADKLNLGQELFLITQHTVVTLRRGPKRGGYAMPK
ncbi:hypothetical protein ACQP3D_29685, partial [Escherichia coli]